MFRHKKSLLLFLLPGLAVLVVFYAVPLIGGVWYSLTDGTLRAGFVGMDNYRRVLGNPMFRLGLQNTLALAAICAPGIFILSFALAAALKGLGARGHALRGALVLPYLIPSSAVLLVWLLLFDYGGPINRLLSMLRLPRILWLDSEALRVPIVLLYIWKNAGFSMVIFSSALQSVPDAYYEYAATEGAGAFRRAVSIMLPLIAPTAFLVLLLALLNALRIFKEAYFIGGAYPSGAAYTLQHFMSNAFARLDFPAATAAAYVFAAVLLIVLIPLYASHAVRARAT